jgi:hypothetical protein
MKSKKTARPKATARHKTSTPRAHYPRGWNRKRAQDVADYYDNQSDDAAIAEAEAAYGTPGTTMMQIPIQLVPAVRKLIGKKVG